MSWSYFDLKLPKPIDGCNTVGELSDKGCPVCGKKLSPEGSCGFGSLHCSIHGCVFLWLPTFREPYGVAPRKYKRRLVANGQRSD